ncbi:vitamin B12-dependent ribonucleotide reductase [Thermoactinomyces mirandus]|uniref:Vitamin B12-dependent ribonucleotide reductase n=1 Tax=Thermoactinomyces mirandus TaxID=2756294 RepID=A0A7W1XPH0_9BACL|nr:vitamin B12-dependent ribonucleotide reductase [Thermoactinomyces mirandus]MBA4600882.1 vitamin B12-dependent ribonucleotide reductase [Thermoactinomyces mirandus]
MKITRFFTKKGQSPYDSVEYSKRDCRITDPNGTVVFEMTDVEVPKAWSQVASDILVSKYFRKAGVPQTDEKGNFILDVNGQKVLGPETSVKQVVHRLVGCWREWGEKYGYFDTGEDAQAFYDELVYMLLNQIAAPNSPQWFNTGLKYAYGITGKPQGHYYVDPETEELKKSQSAYDRPQPHACFILSVEDDLVNENGIMDLWVREARLFKYGSGTGSNFSNIRGKGETLSGGGTSSGLLSFLKIGDRAAGAIKSGGTTRRAAKMVCLDMDHPDIEEFINWKLTEEKKAKALIAAGYDPSFNGEAYETVSGQNSNNSVRVPHSFFKKLYNREDWELTYRTTGEVCKRVPAESLWKQIGQAAWECADPGLQYDGTINEWHTTPAGMDGKTGARHNRINASNPCSEYMFLDNTACNLASLNLVKFFDSDTCKFDIPAFRHSCRLWTIVLEISVLMAQYPSREIARLSYLYRTLGLGYANIGTLLMLAGIPYDSKRALAITGAITSIMTGVAYSASAEMAKELGTFKAYSHNRDHMLRVIRNHRRAAYDAPAEEYEGLEVKPMGIDPEYCPADLLEAARKAWDEALSLGEKYGYRNAQTTLLAPTGTIGLLMDCDTTGIEPDFALVKFKKLAGGGYFKIANQSIRPALKNLGYTREQIDDILTYVTGTLSLDKAPHINRESLKQKGLTDAELDRVEEILPTVFELSFAFNRYTLTDECLQRLGFTPEQYESADFHLLKALGFTEQEIDEANDVICGMMTIEGAPHLREEDYPVFDTANPCGKHGTRFIHYMGHLRMMAAAQPFLSGAISKTINMPNNSTVKDILNAYEQGWKQGLKAVALYRDGSKSSQPLNSRGDRKKEEDAPQEEVSSSASELKEVIATGHVSSIRRRLPRKRDGFTQEARIAGQKIFVRTGEYEDGSLGEIFIDMHKAGSTIRGMLDAFAVAVSLGLQYGVPLEKYVNSLTFTRFEPAGMVEHSNIKMATSVIDYVFRMLGMEYLGRTDFVQVPPREEELRYYINRHKKKAAQSGSEHSAIQQMTEEQHSHEEHSSQDNLDAIRASSGAPLCIECGGMTKRNGSCYVCLDCGATTGCS